MKGKHTPGPWRVYQGWVHPSFDHPSPHRTNGDTAICEPLGPDRVANAKVMAAAPDMLDALEAWSAFNHHRLTCTKCQEKGQCCEEGDGIYSYAVDKSVAAMVKARGHSPATGSPEAWQAAEERTNAYASNRMAQKMNERGRRLAVSVDGLKAEGITSVPHNVPFLFRGSKWALYSIDLQAGTVVIEPVPGD